MLFDRQYAMPIAVTGNPPAACAALVPGSATAVF